MKNKEYQKKYLYVRQGARISIVFAEIGDLIGEYSAHGIFVEAAHIERYNPILQFLAVGRYPTHSYVSDIKEVPLDLVSAFREYDRGMDSKDRGIAI